MIMKSTEKYSYLLSLGHFCSDINQGALSAILPFLIAARHYDYATAGLLVMAANITGSVIQPLFGQLADKKNLPWLLGLSLLLAGGGMALTGFTENFALLCMAVIVSGIGIAMFHPQAARLVHKASGADSKGKSISIFSFGGNLGFTCGPLAASAALTAYGLPGTAVFFIPAFGSLLAMLWYAPRLKALGAIPPAATADAAKAAASQDNWPAFYKLCAVVFSRSVIFYGFNTFISLYFIQQLGQDKAVGTFVLSIFYAVGALSTLGGGWLADRYGCGSVIRLSFTLLLPAIILFTLPRNVYLAALLLVPVGCLLSLSYSPMVVLGQQYLPNHIGAASGVTLGLAVSIGGIAAPILGKIADAYDLLTVIYILAAAAAIPLVISRLLPKNLAEK